MAIDRHVGRRVAEDDGRALLAHQATKLAGSRAFPHKAPCPLAATNLRACWVAIAPEARVRHRLGTNAAFAPQYATRARGAGPATAPDGAVAALIIMSTTGFSGDRRSRDPPTVRSAALGAYSDRVDAALASRQPAVEPVGKEIDRVIEFDRAGMAYAPAHFAFHFVLDQRFTERFGAIGCCRRRNRRAQGTAVHCDPARTVGDPATERREQRRHGAPALPMRQDRCRGAVAEEGCAFAGAPTTARLAVARCTMCSITFTVFVEERPEYIATEIATELGSTGGDGPGQRTSQDLETTNNPLRFGIARNQRGRPR